MARSLAAPFAFQTLNGKAKFIKGQPLYKIVFNKPVRLHKISAGPLLQQWIDTNLSMTMYTKKLLDIMKQYLNAGLKKCLMK